MEIMALGMSIIFMLIYYFKYIRNASGFLNTSYGFFYKNLIKRKSKLNFLFGNRKCDLDHPRLKPIAISFLIGLFSLVLIFINTIVAVSFGEINEKGITYYVALSLWIFLYAILGGSLIYCMISNIRSEKYFEKCSQEELNDMIRQIEKEWPEFFFSK